MSETIKTGKYKHPWPTDCWSRSETRRIKLIDLRVSGLPFDDRQNIHKLVYDIGSRSMEKMVEERDGFPSYRRMKYTDEQIENETANTVDRCRAVNEYMEKVGRPALFHHLDDKYLLAWEYYELVRYQEEEEFAKKYFVRTEKTPLQEYIENRKQLNTVKEEYFTNRRLK